MNLTQYHATYFAYELTKQTSSDNLEKLAATLMDAQVDLNPHQVEAALFAFKSPLSKGAILADEVGLGKTIEAGLVISQKWAEKKRKILIIVPANLRKQWNLELLDKFYLPSMILESLSFKDAIKKGNLNPFIQSEIIICSYQFARAQEHYIKLVNWDLVVIDEAHRLRNVYRGNKIATAIKAAVADRPKILLTATPLQNSLLELYGLVSIIDELVFGDKKSFQSQFARIADDENPNFNDLKDRLKPICKRTLRRNVQEYINYTSRIPLTQEFFPTPEEEKLYELVSEYLRREDLFALPKSQRHLMTLILRKLLGSSTYAISGTLEGLYKKLENVLEKNEIPPKEEITDILAADYEDIDELEDEWDNDEEKEEKLIEKDEIPLLKNEIEDLKQFHKLAKTIVKNSKGDVLQTALKKGFDKIRELGGNKKAIVFTESKRTQEYLFKILEETEYKDKIVMFNGSNNDPKSKTIYKNWVEKNKNSDRMTGSPTADMRTALVDYFKDKAEIMIATEAAAEGINLQFCSIVINYDLPWNPQRIEQRIGRCHRYGQKYDVVVLNFINKKNEADQRVYELLDQKFKLFSGVFGSSDEVLGAIESGVDIERKIGEIYQKCRTSEEIKSSFDKLQKDLEEQISANIQSAKQTLLDYFDETVHEKLKMTLQNSREYLSKYESWLWKMSQAVLKDQAYFNPQDYCFTLEKNPFPDEIIPLGTYQLGRNIEKNHHYRIQHPLAQKMIQALKSGNLENQSLVFNYTGARQNIAMLEELVGKQGWLSLSLFTVESFETEETLIWSGFADDGVVLDGEQCSRFFSLEADENKIECSIPEHLTTKMSQHYQGQIIKTMEQVAAKNAHWFDEESDKLDKWAEDLKIGLEKEIKDLDAEIKLKKAEAKKASQLEEKVRMQRQVKDLESKRNEKRRRLFEAQDEIEKRKEELISQTENRLKQSSQEKKIFTIRWELV